jgi:phage terminase large subunit-like protein
LRGAWNEAWFCALEAFSPDAVHEDDADATAEAFNALMEPQVTVRVERLRL